ncbi:MAG: NAD-dependent epimerase/dehydratase family protein [Verrucomicrobiia bacterium]
MNEPARNLRVAIVGAGYLGQAMAREIVEEGHEIVLVSRSKPPILPPNAAFFECDVTDRDAISSVARRSGSIDCVIQAVSTRGGGESAYRELYFKTAGRLQAAWPEARHLFCGSTSVYAQNNGAWVSEEDPAEPQTETGRILLETERQVLEAGGLVARLAGLYGKGRSVYLRKVRDGTAAIDGDGSRFINQIHCQDAARAMAMFARSEHLKGVFNVCDGCPLPISEVYQAAAKAVGAPPPPFGGVRNTRRGESNKRVSCGKLRGLGWSPRYPSYLDWLLDESEIAD